MRNISDEELDALEDVFDCVADWEKLGIYSHTMPNAIGMWDKEVECLAWLCRECNWDKHWVEIGAFCGGSACVMNMMRCLKKSHGQGSIISVDMDFNPMFDINIKRTRCPSLHHKMEINSSDFSEQFKKDFPDDEISFVLIDGFHSFSQAMTDFEQVEQFLTDDAIVAFHDASPFIYDEEHQDRVVRGVWKYEEGVEDFRIDEVICSILNDSAKDYDRNNQDYYWELVKNPMQGDDCQHFEETGLTEWVRGTTSPFNALAAIRKVITDEHTSFN